MTILKAPFPYFGGKRTVAAEVWRRFGDVSNFIEPFAGSAAVLLARPYPPRLETINDIDAHLTNAWRAIQAAPDEVARYASWPVSELDLHARGDWLFYRPDVHAFIEQLRADPDYYDAKSAGWWVWFASCWIGGLPAVPKDGNTGQGGNEDGVYKRRPAISKAGEGVHRSGRVNRQLSTRPHLGSGGQGNGVHGTFPGNANETTRLEMIIAYMQQLSQRLRRVRICCGDWTRVLTPSVTWKHGLTGIFLDPPYSHAERDNKLYSHDNDVAGDVRQWCIENGDNPLLRIALCGYDTEHNELEDLDWQPYYWKTNGGYGNLGNGRGKANRERETIWFSPHCLNPTDTLPLFAHVNGHNNGAL